MLLPSTTDPPSGLIFPPVRNERLAACSVLYLLAVICSLCVILTVIRTKSVRGQLLGVMLINLAIAVLIRAMTVVVRDIESDSRGGIENFGTVGCHVYHNGYNVSEAVINAAILIICLDTTFSFPQSRIVQTIASVFIWVFAIIFSCVHLYYLSDGLSVGKWANGSFCYIYLKRPGWIRDIMYFLIFHFISTTLVLFSTFRFCCSHSTNKATRGRLF